jgi:hypothetical protein
MDDVTFPRARDILVQVQHIIGEVAGTGAQQFSEDTTYNALGRAFDITFIKRPWEQYLRWGSYALDGVSGKIVDDNPFGDVSSPDLRDFIAVYRNGEQKPLPVLSNKVNPYIYTGDKVLYWTSLAASDPDYVKKRLKFYPTSATTQLNIGVRIRPVSIVPDTVLYLDRMMLEMGTAWQVLDADGSNPGAADTFKQLFDLRFRDIEHNFANQPIEITGDSSIPTDWFEHP